MEYEDIRTIATPEGVELSLPLANIGSRFLGLFVDLLIQYGLLLAAVLGTVVLAGGLVADIVFAILGLLILLGYDVLFEVLGGGRTIGKRAAALRVVEDSGAPVSLRASLVRNLIRLVEGNLLFYVPAMISVLVTSSNQRLGDLAAGTLVVRDPRATATVPVLANVDPDTVAAWDVSGVRDEDLTAVRSFLARRGELDRDARVRLAGELAGRLRPRVAGAPPLEDEGFLERLAVAKAASAG